MKRPAKKASKSKEPKLPEARPGLTLVFGETFEDREIVLAGQHFIGCKFVRCSFTWNLGPFWIQNCAYEGNRRLTLVNPISCETVDVLKILGFLEPEFAAGWKRN